MSLLHIAGVQRRFTRLIPGMAVLPEEERLSRLVLYSLELRKVRGDLIETYKILTGLDGRFRKNRGGSRTRGHTLRKRGKQFRTEVRRNFFTQRVVNAWNSLPQNVIEAKTLSDFEKKLDIALGAKGSKGYWGGGAGDIKMNGGAVSKGQIASSCFLFLCFSSVQNRGKSS